MIRKGMEKMNFQECLNNYIIQIRCNGKELARNSEISETVISRYRKGERAPSADSEYLKKLSDGIIKTAAEKGIRDFQADKVLQTLRESLEDNRDEPAFNSQKLDILLRELDINISRIAAFLHYDPSYLSKIRTGKRNPAHQQQFIEKICEYVASNYKDEQDRKKVTYLIQCNEDELTDSSLYRKKLHIPELYTILQIPSYIPEVNPAAAVSSSDQKYPSRNEWIELFLPASD